MNLRMIYQTYKTEIDGTPHKINKQKKEEDLEKNLQIESVITDARVNTIQSHYPTDYASKPTSISTVDEDEEDIVQKRKGLDPVVMKSIEANMNVVQLDESRIVYPNSGSSGLYEFVPATQLKGK